jgi:hypothetical protein
MGEPNGIGPDVPDVTLVVWWRSFPPSAAEIRAVRKAFPELTETPLAEFLRQAGDSPRFVIGRFPKVYATAALNRLLDTGLDLRIEE